MQGKLDKRYFVFAGISFSVQSMLIYCKFLTERVAVDYRSFLVGHFLFAVLGRAFPFISPKFITGK